MHETVFQSLEQIDSGTPLNEVIETIAAAGHSSFVLRKTLPADERMSTDVKSPIDLIRSQTGKHLDERDGLLKKSGEYFSLVEKYGRLYLLKTIREWGICLNEGETFTLQDLVSKLSIKDEFLPQLAALLDILVCQEYIDLKGEKYTVQELAVVPATVNALDETVSLKNDILRQFSDMDCFFDLIEMCLDNSLKIMAGSVNATEIMFPMFSMDLVGRIFKGYIMADHFNEMTAISIGLVCRSFLDKKVSGKPVRILEIGSGTGGTSDSVMKAVAENRDNVEYYFTDISKGFVRMGQKKLGRDFPFAKFKILNIESPGDKPGFEKGSFDIIFASNVIHATTLIEKSLSGVYSLLKPGGLFLMTEVTDKQDFTTLTFGFLDGWWLFEDPEKRIPNSPLLRRDTWLDEFEKAGFVGSDTLSSSHIDKEDSFSQSIFMAEKAPLGKDPMTVMDVVVAYSIGEIDRNQAESLLGG
jgi:SAM-dependent methyltransferase